LQKFTTLWFRPFPCDACSHAAYLPVRTVIYALLLWTALTWVFIASALFMGNVLYLFGTLPALLFAVDLLMLRAPLQRL
jgi:hypothetical protein